MNQKVNNVKNNVLTTNEKFDETKNENEKTFDELKAKNEDEKTFDEIISEFLYFKKLSVKQSTLSNYKYNIKHRIYPEFYSLNLKDLENYDYNKFSAELSKTLSQKTIRDTIILLKSILMFVSEKYSVPIKMKLITLPKFNKKKVQIFNNYERKKLEKFLLNTNDIQYLGMLISLYEGLRIGEACCLKWKNINLKEKTITIEKTMQRMYIDNNRTEIVITSPKTISSNRVIPIGKTLFEKLKYLKKNFNDDDFVITGSKSKIIEPSTYRNKYKKLLSKLDIEYKNYHTLRHTFATRCIQVGMDAKSLSEILGHSNVTTTLEIYVHSSFETKKKFLNKL